MACTEAHKAAARKWYLANKEKAKASRKAHYEANKEKYVELNKRWKAANPDRLKEQPSRSKCYHKPEVQRAYRERNADRIRDKARERFKTDPKYKALNALNAAKRRRAACAWADATRVRTFYEEAARMTAETGVRYDVDHVVPLNHPLVCGLHNEFNLRVITASENRSRRNRFEIEP